jgi:predicted nucleic acid-binding protein
MAVVADTSALVSLGCADELPLLDILVAEYEVVVPEVVVSELEDVAAYDDEQAEGAQSALHQSDEVIAESVSIDADFPLDDGENGAVILANNRNASMLLCDEFNKIGLIHASLDDVKLATTPTFLRVLETNDFLSTTEVELLLDEIGEVRSWNGNRYVERVRNRL